MVDMLPAYDVRLDKCQRGREKIARIDKCQKGAVYGIMPNGYEKAL